MRLVVQRVARASVVVKGKMVGKIEAGLFVLVGVAKTDHEEAAVRLAGKLSKLRILADKEGKMNLSLKETDMPVLVVSQFTLYADTSQGNRPSFIGAADPALAEKVYQRFIKELRALGLTVQTGLFGAYMEIKTELDGPVTILLD